MQYKKSIEEQIGEYMPRFLRQANANIEKQVEEVMALPKLLLNSESTLAILRKDSYQSRADQNKDRFTVNNYLARTYLNGMNEDVIGVFVLSKNRLFYSSKIKFTGLDWEKMLIPYGQDMDLRGKEKITLPNETKLRFEGGVPYVLFMKQIQDVDNRKDLGTMFIAVKLTFIDRILMDFEQNNNAKMWIANRRGNIIYHTDPNAIGTTDPSVRDYPIWNGSFRVRKGKELQLISVTESKSFDGILVHSIPLQDLTARTDMTRKITIIIFICFVMITTLFAVVFVLRVTRPIKRLIRLMKEAERGKFQLDLKTHSLDEVGTLARSFNSMMTTIRDLIEKNYDIKIRQQEAELYALQSQINPHFMYNTLETISMAIEEGEADMAVDMVTQLGRMLRYSVENKSNFVPFSEELQHVMDYLTIQKFRFEDRLVFEIIRKSDPGFFYMPKFILQPVVENAIKYGLESRERLDIEISISKEFDARSGDTAIVFRVRDNGPGMKRERLEEVEKSLKTGTLSGRKSQFGLGNVNARIVMIHGPEYGLQLHSVDGKGTEVTIRIPLIAMMDRLNLEQGEEENHASNTDVNCG
ncbi:sensor histidine kinase [Paenibacillus enshidis]|uniref:histidine kinase n=1 Tax=Paenibacillus enshidis TaxID=1458439 RepID=A0ABV5AY89_9BACL